MKKALSVLVAAAMAVSLGACSNKTDNGGDKKDAGSLVIYSPHPLEFIDPIVNEFENKTGVKVEVVAAGSGELLKRVEAEGDNPMGDILWGGSLSTLEPKKNT